MSASQPGGQLRNTVGVLMLLDFTFFFSEADVATHCGTKERVTLQNPPEQRKCVKF